jgi:hypothetical protein
MTIIATPGAVDANSYLTVAEADAYHAARLHNTAWTTADEATKESALQWATRVLDRESWVGCRTNESQGLRWPRTEVYDQDDYWVPQDQIPKFLKDATAELAFLLLTSDRTADAGTEGLKDIKVGPIEIAIDLSTKVKTMSPEVWDMISFYCESGASSLTLERG